MKIWRDYGDPIVVSSRKKRRIDKNIRPVCFSTAAFNRFGPVGECRSSKAEGSAIYSLETF